MSVLIRCVWCLVWMQAIGQEHPMRAGDEFPLAGLGTTLFFRPAAVFMNPAILATDSMQGGLELSMDQFHSLALTKRVEFNAAVQLPAQDGIGFRIARVGKENFRLSQFGIAYARRISSNRLRLSFWTIGAAIQYQHLQLPARVFDGGWQGAVAVNYQTTQNLWVIRVVSSSAHHWGVVLGNRRLWSDQLSTDVLAVLNTMQENRIQLAVQYAFVPRAYLRIHLQSRPSIIGWEQGYRLKLGWLTAHCIRYPSIGWKTGVGLLFLVPVKQVGNE